MENLDGVTLGMVAGIIALFCAILSIVSYISSRHKEGYQKGETDGSMREDIRYMRNSIDDMRLDFKEVARKQTEQGEKLIRFETRLEQVEKRLDMDTKDDKEN